MADSGKEYGKLEDPSDSMSVTPMERRPSQRPYQPGDEPGPDCDSLANGRQRVIDTERLLDQHHETVYRYAYRLCGCASTAEDIVQEVFLRAFRSLHQLRDEASARGWLLVIARNEFMRCCRKSAAGGSSVDPSSCEVPIESDEPSVERQEWVERALEQLPDEFRLVLLMFYFEELSYAEIATQLKIPIGTVMSRLSRGRSHMKAALEKFSPPSA